MLRKSSPLDDYDIIEQIGLGSFGTVHKAKHKTTNHTVAVKIMKKKFTTASQCLHLREYKALQHLSFHPNIVQLHATFLAPTKELFFVMELMNGGNLYHLLKERRDTKRIIEPYEVKSILFQILDAVAHIHHFGIFHRDMKPENVLIHRVPDGTVETSMIIIKLADFGLARELKSKPPYTDYVSTRWYRAPEVLLRSNAYSYPVDLWAIGVIFAEILCLRPLFPGDSEIDQLYRICQLLGSPAGCQGAQPARRKRSKSEKLLRTGFERKRSNTTTDVPVLPEATTSPIVSHGGGEWREGIKLASKLGFEFPPTPPISLFTVIPRATEPLIDLLRQFLFFDPAKRIKAKDALMHPFFLDQGQPFKNPAYQGARNASYGTNVADCLDDPSVVRRVHGPSSIAKDFKDVFRLPKAKLKDPKSNAKPSKDNDPFPLASPPKHGMNNPGIDLPFIPHSPLQVHSDWDQAKQMIMDKPCDPVGGGGEPTGGNSDIHTGNQRLSVQLPSITEQTLNDNDNAFSSSSTKRHSLLDLSFIDQITMSPSKLEQDMARKTGVSTIHELTSSMGSLDQCVFTIRKSNNRIDDVPISKQGDQTYRWQPTDEVVWPTHRELVVRPSLSIPLQPVTNRSEYAPNDRYAISGNTAHVAPRRLLKKKSDHSLLSRRKCQLQKEWQTPEPPSSKIPRAESVPDILSRHFSSPMQRSTAEIKQRDGSEKITRRSLSMRLDGFLAPDIMSSSSVKKKMPRLNFWTKKHTATSPMHLMNRTKPPVPDMAVTT
ncbi:kinase-like domain-containing protein [Radiomyces spectabilis]|uniref:kinase-like domain-containing protein n=1 Tax=Radiomyces spectabilis TaxID=64574 RepID=UPI00221FD7FB|nr:kinase-like domain-containing protein [Radiomyces spectabilis]KAI8379096.1 kinase-like domain-containing protein [Radiomyces spectabilis]